jgi:hypothetical protein
MKRFSVPFLLACFVVATAALSGCNKKEDTFAKIYIRNSGNALVSGVKVILYGEASEPGKQGKVNISDTVTTNSAGEAIFNLNYMYQAGQAGVAVLNITAKKNLESGSGIIKIVEEETNEETVFIQ